MKYYFFTLFTIAFARDFHVPDLQAPALAVDPAGPPQVLNFHMEDINWDWESNALHDHELGIAPAAAAADNLHLPPPVLAANHDAHPAVIPHHQQIANQVHEEPLIFNQNPVPQADHVIVPQSPPPAQILQNADNFVTPPAMERPTVPPPLVQIPRVVPRLVPVAPPLPVLGANEHAVAEAIQQVASTARRLRFKRSI